MIVNSMGVFGSFKVFGRPQLKLVQILGDTIKLKGRLFKSQPTARFILESSLQTE